MVYQWLEQSLPRISFQKIAQVKGTLCLGEINESSELRAVHFPGRQEGFANSTRPRNTHLEYFVSYVLCVYYTCEIYIYSHVRISIKYTAFTYSAVTPFWCCPIGNQKYMGALLPAVSYLSLCPPGLQQQQSTVTAVRVSRAYGQLVPYIHIWNHCYAILIFILKASCNFSNVCNIYT